MRATSPLDCIEYKGTPVAMPQPKYAVGTVLDLRKLSAHDYRYYAKCVLREVLRDTQKIIYRLKLQGYMTGMVGKKMLPGNKEQIRLKLFAMKNAHTVEIAGMSPYGMHVVGTVGNECYLQNGQCHSGMHFDYYLLFRCEHEGNQIVYVHPYSIIGEPYIKALLAAPASSDPHAT